MTIRLFILMVLISLFKRKAFFFIFIFLFIFFIWEEKCNWYWNLKKATPSLSLSLSLNKKIKFGAHLPFQFAFSSLIKCYMFIDLFSPVGCFYGFLIRNGNSFILHIYFFLFTSWVLYMFIHVLPLLPSVYNHVKSIIQCIKIMVCW